MQCAADYPGEFQDAVIHYPSDIAAHTSQALIIFNTGMDAGAGIELDRTVSVNRKGKGETQPKPLFPGYW